MEYSRACTMQAAVDRPAPTRACARATLYSNETPFMPHSRLRVRALAAAVVLTLSTGSVWSQVDPALKQSVDTALQSNPELSARFNAYRASIDATDVARGGFFPRLDLNARAAREQSRVSSRNPTTESLSHGGVGLTLSQLLWDGLGTRNEWQRTGHERLARYFELRDASEQVALEAARAHYDVLRYARLLALAEDNYVQHRYAVLQIQSRFKAGVGRGVDLEQANARLALAEANLSTETANFHDVVARYQRIVGTAPGTATSTDTPARLAQGLPASQVDALALALAQNAAISAGIESLRAARSAVQAQNAVFQPRVEARLRASGGSNLDAYRDQTRNAAAEVVLNWNLYNGGSDQARVRQQVNLASQAADQRDRACRDTRQTINIAYNDTRRLTEQLNYLDRNALSISKARDAYRQQFDIGQRSLLDLLNAENELYTARRSYVNAEYDLSIAYVRAHAAMNQLLGQLGLAQSAPSEDEGWSGSDAAPQRCPLAVPEISVTERGELDRRAQKIAESATAARVPPAPALPASAPARR